MTPEENRRRAADEHVKYIKDNLFDSEREKPFVFISYKSDDWETVLHDIVYRLVKDYGLRVYFDGSFDVHNDLWITQFPENMESYLCRGVLAFVDNKYVTSYATVLELMYSQTAAAEKKVVQVNLGKLTSFDNAEGALNTGLGVETYEDNTKNVYAGGERDLFFETYTELKDGEPIKLKKTRFLYKKGQKLTKKKCSQIAVDLLGYLKINENPYHGPNGSLEGIVGSIRDAFGDDVFGPVTSEDLFVTVRFQNEGEHHDIKVKKGHKVEEPAALSKDGYDFKGWYRVVPDAEIRWDFQADKADTDIELYARWEKHEPPQSGRISLNEFFKIYNVSNFKKDTYSMFRLTGTDGCEKYGTEYAQSAFDLAWEFVMKLLAERGMSYIQEVTEKHPNLKNPVFINRDDYDKRGDDKKKYRQISVSGLEQYYMYRHYSQYNWLDSVLKPRLIEFGLPIDKFYFEFVSEDDIDIILPVPQPDKVGNGGTADKKDDHIEPGEITGPVPVVGEKQKSVETVTGSYALEDFLANFSNRTFQSKSCKSIKLVGVNGCEGYTADKNAKGEPFESARQMVFHFAMARIDETGTKYIETVNNAYPNTKNPIFITQEEHQRRKERKESVTYTAATSKAGKGYSMCTHYSEYDWINNSLVKQLRALGLDLKDFRLEFQ